jgi:soluble lytic murein transglycosylase
MRTRAVTMRREPQRPKRQSPTRSTVRRRRTLTLLVGLAVIVVGVLALRPLIDDAIKEITLPLRHEDIIRQQARDKQLDPALIAAVIYRESKFRDQTSQAGAKGLMQILPSTADYIAHKSGGTEFEQGDLATPQINISYGSWYLRYLLDRYDGNKIAAVAAYNAGETKVDEWGGGSLEIEDIGFPETKVYARDVLAKRGEYAREYDDELGL